MIVLIVYVLGVVAAVWPLSQWIGSGLGSEDDEGDPQLAALDAGLAFLLSLMWPAVLLGVGAYRLSRRIWAADDEQVPDAGSIEQ